jgi:hypothetical protein
MSREVGPTAALRIEALEDRLVPTLTFQFDYTFDTTGMFNDPAKRAVLEQVGHDIGSHIASTPDAIAPSGGNTWGASFFNPTTGGQTTVNNLSIPAGVIVVYVGARTLDGAEAAQGGFGGYSWSGSPAWGSEFPDRGQGFAVWGGSLAFDTRQTWYTGPAAGLTAGAIDMYTVASHEIGHLLGLGTADKFHQLTVNGVFTGANADAVFGSAPPVAADGAHFGSGLVVGGQAESMQPALVTGRRYGLSALDYAALQDIGWGVGSVSPTPVTSPPSSPPVTTPTTTTGTTSTTIATNNNNQTGTTTTNSNTNQTGTTPTGTTTTTTATGGQSGGHADPILPKCNCGACGGCLAVSGAGGTFQLYDVSNPAWAMPLGDVIQAFPGFTGTVRTITADVNGDGTPDVIAVTGPGGGSQVRVIDGATGLDLLDPFSVFEPSFSGGLYVTAADLNGDGQAEVIVSPDQGGGGRVEVLRVANGTATVVANFFGIDDPNFRGGARVAAADVNGDGVPDIVVGAGFGGGPRVAIFDGASVTTHPRKLVHDFYAFDGPDAVNLRNGVYPAAGDLNGDGRADLVFGGGPGGGPRVLVLDGALALTSLAAARANPLANFFAFDANARDGVRPVVKDVTKDGRPDLVVASGTAGDAQVNVYAGGAGQWAHGSPVSAATYNPSGITAAADGVYVG